MAPLLDIRQISVNYGSKSMIAKSKRNNDIMTLGSLGIIAYSFTFYCHEIIGHALTMRFLGQKHMVLTTAYIISPDPIISPFGTENAQRLISAMGTLSNFLAGIIFYWFYKISSRRKWSVQSRYTLWLMMAINLFFGSSYILYSGIFGVADWADVIVGLPGQSFLRYVEIICGVSLCYISYRLAKIYLPCLPGNTVHLTLFPYVAASSAYILSTYLIPASWYIIVTSAVAAPLIGQGILPLLALSSKSRANSHHQISYIEFSWPTVVAGVLCALLALVVAPGLDFTL